MKRLLIEEWLPIAALGEESMRERRSMTALPPTYYLHVWFARRPLVASRAAVLASLLPADADREKFLHVLGIHGDPVASKIRIAQATQDGVRLGAEAYGYPRAFSYAPTASDLAWIGEGADSAVILDPTAGGGSVPFEAVRLGFCAHANDLNAVAALILKATIELPLRFGTAVLVRYKQLGATFAARVRDKIRDLYPTEPSGWTCDGYIWARTITCPYCEGLIPLSPTWALSGEGAGVCLKPDVNTKRCTFEIVWSVRDHSKGTVKGGAAECPFPGCGRVIDSDQIKSQAQAGQMGQQLYAVVYKYDKVVGHTKSGDPKIKRERAFRTPRLDDDVEELVAQKLREKMPEWQARDIVPDEGIPSGHKTDEPRRSGMYKWQDMFAPRQLYCHCTSVEVYQDLVAELQSGALSEIDRAAMAYVSIAIDKVLNYNSRMSVWMASREVVVNTFNRHDFAFCWSHSEMAPTVTGLGYDWAIECKRQTNPSVPTMNLMMK